MVLKYLITPISLQRLIPPYNLLNLPQRLIPQDFLQPLLDLIRSYRRSQPEYLHRPPLLYKLSLDPQSLLRHLLPTVITNLLIPSLPPPLLQIPLNLQPPHRLYFLLLTHPQQPPYVLHRHLLFQK